jgi:hypothetical protein
VKGTDESSPPRLGVALTVLFTLVSPFVVAQARPDTRTPDKMPTPDEIKNPPKTWIDKGTGHRIVRLTDEPGSASFYFNVNGYTPDGTAMVYTNPDVINVLNLKTHATRNVVKGKVRTMEVGHKTPSIFYIKLDEDAIYKTNLSTGETKMLAKAPLRGRVITVNADETLAAGTYDDVDRPNEQFGRNGGTVITPSSPQTSPLEEAAHKGEMMEKRLAARIPLVLFTIDLTGSSKVTPLLHSTDWINHLLFSPTDPTLLMYCHEGP